MKYAKNHSLFNDYRKIIMELFGKHIIGLSGYFHFFYLYNESFIIGKSSRFIVQMKSITRHNPSKAMNYLMVYFFLRLNFL